MSGKEMFENIYEVFMDGDDKTKKLILSFFTPDEQAMLQKCIGLYRMMNDAEYYKLIEKATYDMVMAKVKDDK